MGSLENRVAIVTGGAMGIGGASARKLASDGARVLIADVNMPAAQENAARIRAGGGVAEALEIDITHTEQISGMIDRAVELWGRLDFLVNNAWTRQEPDGSALTLSEAAWDHAMSSVLKAVFVAAKYAAPHMAAQGSGAIVNIASVHGQFMAPGKMAYEVNKAGVIALTRQMATDLGPMGIRVNAICPGHIVTERMQEYFWDRNPTMRPFFEAQYPVRRVGKPDDIAAAVHFLCTDGASFITGVALPVDGGLTIQLQEDLGLSLARLVRAHPEIQLPG
jgi:NAD(P)-dependent dehydrogenase (short-subunit alcohol dehydrogenase family)